MKYLLGFFLMLCITPVAFSMQNQDLISNEIYGVSTEKVEMNSNAFNYSNINSGRFLEVDFKSDYSRTLIERGDLSLSRKILMNAGGARIEPTAFQFDLHLEISYKFI